MTRRSARSGLARAGFGRLAALLAVALLTFAGVRSTVMQAAEAWGSSPGCGAHTMAGMSGMGAMSKHEAPGKAPMRCDFCAAAAHVPVASATPTLPAPTAVAWFAPAPAPALGPRGPPSTEPRARDPPALPTA